MFRQLAVVAVLAVAALAAPIENFDDIPEQFKSLIPEEVATHLKSITADEKAALKELAKEHKNYKDEKEFLAALKDKSPSLHEKAVKLQAYIQAKLDKLGADAKAFVEKVIAEARDIHRAYLAGSKPTIEELKGKVQGFIAQYKALSEESKTEFRAQFPILAKAVQNPEIKALAEKYIN